MPSSAILMITSRACTSITINGARVLRVSLGRSPRTSLTTSSRSSAHFFPYSRSPASRCGEGAFRSGNGTGPRTTLACACARGE
eukprot:scaffold5766_cov110-Isochrysis_galbana.AAC.7